MIILGFSGHQFGRCFGGSHFGRRGFGRHGFGVCGRGVLFCCGGRRCVPWGSVRSFLSGWFHRRHCSCASWSGGILQLCTECVNVVIEVRISCVCTSIVCMHMYLVNQARPSLTFLEGERRCGLIDWCYYVSSKPLKLYSSLANYICYTAMSTLAPPLSYDQPALGHTLSWLSCCLQLLSYILYHSSANYSFLCHTLPWLCQWVKSMGGIPRPAARARHSVS